MKYIEITIHTESEWVEPVLACLSMAGIDDAEVRDPRDAEEIMADKETYEWDYVDEKVSEGLDRKPEIHIYRDSVSEKDDEALVCSVRDAMEKLRDDICSGVYGAQKDPGDFSVSSEIKDDTVWKNKWKEYFKPSHVSDRIVVKPTWEAYEPEADEIVIEIDPGMAFGTGTHETTSMCIRALEKYVREGMKVLDAGCGSGILSIAAAKLGAGEVLGVDIDEEAVRVSGENFRLNNTDDICRAEYGDVTKGVGFNADLVAANLMAELLCMISKGVASHLQKGGIFISSGILDEKEDMVKQSYSDAGFDVTGVMHDGEWCCVIAEKK
ncbi:MAG: 50S ribosomal protein L11 methyltransferase [Eubacterium sp.]|nr:50S ribosomal protein L11 methyltransferase [Eubacterium sp.]